MSLKNNGQRLVSKFRGIVDNIPQRWRSRLATTEIKQKVTLDVDLTELAGGVVASKVVHDQINERQRVDTLIDDPTGQTMVEYVRTKEGQIGTRILKYIPEGTALPTLDELTVEAGQDASGNGFVEQAITKTPNLFGGFDYTTEMRDIIPPEFTALLPLITGEANEPGTPDLFIELDPGELLHREAQVTEQYKRVTIHYRSLLDLPKVIVERDTNREKQVVTIVKILDLDTVAPALPTAIRDVKWDVLGNGLAVQTIRVTDAIFVGAVYAKSVLNLIPERLRAAIPQRKHDYTETGAVNVDPPLGAGELSRQETQIDEFNKRIEITSIDTVTGVTVTDRVVQEEFGGSIAARTATLAPHGTITVETGLLVIKSELTDLNIGWDVLDTLKSVDASWPTIPSNLYDKESNIRILVEEQVVDPSYTPVTVDYAVEDVRGLDKWRSKRIRTTRIVSAFNSKANAIISYRYQPFQFPGTLDYHRLITYDHKEGFRRASAMLTRHVVRTWWLKQSTIPTVGDVDLGTFDIDVKEIITDTVNVPIYTEGNSTLAETFPEVLHDDITNSLGASYPATTPSFTKYYLGTGSGSTGTGSIYVLTSPGTAYTVGSGITVCGSSCIILATGVAGSIIAISQPAVPPSGVITTGLTDGGPCVVSGGGGSGAAFNELIVSYETVVPGSGWVGTEKPIAAVIKQDSPGLWKIETESVVMR